MFVVTAMIVLLPTVFFPRIEADDSSHTIEWLTSLYVSTNGALWRNATGWRSSVIGASSLSPCEWHGVQCDASGIVTSVSLVDNGLQGTLSYSFVQNPNLRFLDLSHNHLTGTLPALFFVSFPMLQVLRLSDNALMGTLPDPIGGSHFLTELYLDRNQLTGEVPMGILHCPLRILDLTSNHFLGKPPAGLIFMPILETLRLGRNSFRMQLSELLVLPSGTTSALQSLDLSSNYFEDQIPDTISQFTLLVSLDLTGNILRGTLPVLSSLVHLTHLHIGRNELQGTIPEDVWLLPMLVSIKIDDNHFRGMAPSAHLLKNTNVKFLYLAKNDFSGPIPAYTTLTELTTALNPWECPLPEAFQGWFDAPPTTICTVRVPRVLKNSRSKRVPLTRMTVLWLNFIVFLGLTIPCLIKVGGFSPWRVVLLIPSGWLSRAYVRLSSVIVARETDVVCRV